jgi:hypothetical protein
MKTVLTMYVSMVAGVILFCLASWLRNRGAR